MKNDFKIKRLIEMKNIEKNRVLEDFERRGVSPFKFSTARYISFTPKIEGPLYKMYFYETPQKKYFLAKEIAKRAAYHTILKNHLDDDETINHLAIFTEDQLDDIIILNNLISTWSLNEGIAGYAIYGISLDTIITLCKNKGERSYMPEGCDELIHFLGCHLRRDTNEHRNIAAKKVAKVLMEKHNFSTGNDLGHYLRFQYMYGMQMEYLKVNMRIDEFYSSIPGSKRRTEAYEKKVELIRDKHKKELELLYSNLVESGEISTKWKSEMALFKLVKSNFDDAIFQYYDSWLERQSLDIYIPSLRVGIEYQGIIHYQPVDFFGGEEAFKHRQYLDGLKREKAKNADVKIIEWHYNEPISKAVLLNKLKENNI
ncbi:hypothetical protein [Peribacillus acanthi]|uniref:hypothetical protein n=1 Tax=Peribacillus acanthi TaxID=2171554 RepID=UPI000D3E3AEC|nr:hypothetical protein [Peribacillus acanthi]